MNWAAIAGGVQGLRSGLDWAQENELRGHRLRGLREQATEDRIMGEEARRLTQRPAAQPNAQPPAQAPAAPPAQPAQQTPTALGGGAAAPQPPATTVGDDDPGYAAQQQDAESYRRLAMSGPTALGTPAENPDVRRDTATGAGMVPPNVLLAAVRRSSGNADQPLGRSDYLSYVEAVSQRMAEAGLGHRIPEMRGRIMQSFHSAAARTMAVASAMADAGDLQGAARAMATAYDFVPNGNRMTFGQGPDGTMVAQRLSADGQPVGTPIPVTADAIREMALKAQDPMQYAGLLLAREQRAIQRDTLNEHIRHNRAAEGLMSQRIAAAGARGGGAAGGQIALDFGQRRQAYEDIDNGLLEYEGQASGRERGAATALPLGHVRSIAQSLVETGLPGSEAARLSSAIGLRQVTPLIDESGRVAIEYNGRTAVLPGPTAALLRQFVQAPAAPAASPAPVGPGYSGRRAIREPTR